MSDDSKSLSRRTAVVTGAARSIGLASRSRAVAFNYAKSAGAAEELKKEIEQLSTGALASQCDVVRTDTAAEMVKQVKERFGRINFLVNNAGITRDQLILRMKEDDWDAVIDTNLKGAWNFSRAALRVMLRQEEGSVLKIATRGELIVMDRRWRK